jgi:pSer/pThr/pTyr-binding forkhead associated (FHA) protein
LANEDVLIKLSAVTPTLGETGIVPVVVKAILVNEKSSSNLGYLILEDESLFELISPVTNIGRNSTNHLILNDLRVSRTHAQIRSVGDDYIIFDIGSSGGTYINGERISQRKLKPGDVISLAGIKLIFSEEQSIPQDGNEQVAFRTKPISTSEDLQC